MESDSEITWVKTKNTVEERLIKSSFIHRLAPRKLSKKRKMLNTVFKKYTGLTSYSQYVTIKTSVLQHYSDDSQEDEDDLSDYDYSQSYMSDYSFNNHTLQDFQDDSDIPEQKKTKKSHSPGKSKIRGGQEVDFENKVVAWNNVTENDTLIAQPSCSNDETRTSISPFKRKEILSENKSSPKLNEQSLQEIPVTKKVRLGNSNEKNLVAEQKTETLNADEYNVKNADIDGHISSDSSDTYNENPCILAQSTPLYERTEHKTDEKLHKLLSKKRLRNHPRDSGIDEDSQEDSSRDGKNTVKKLSNQSQEKDKSSAVGTVHTGIAEAVEKEHAKSSIKRRNTISSQCLENKNEDNLQTCRTGQNRTKGENSKPMQKTAAKLNLNKIFENETMASDLNKKEIITPDSKSTECHEELKIAPVQGNILVSPKSNKHDSNNDKKVLDNTSENTMDNNDETQMEDPTFADSENSECTEVTQMTLKSVRKESIKVKRNKRKSTISNSDFSGGKNSETSCDSATENKRQKKESVKVKRIKRKSGISDDDLSEHKNSEEGDKSQASLDSDVNNETEKTMARDTQRQKLAPKVMCTEVVNKKYKIISKGVYNVRKSNVEKELDSTIDSLNESTITSHDEDGNNPTTDDCNNYNIDNENSQDVEKTLKSGLEDAKELQNIEDQEEIDNDVDEDIKEAEEKTLEIQEGEEGEDEKDSDSENVDTINKLHPQTEVSQKAEESSTTLQKSDDDEQEFKNVTNITCLSSGSLPANEFLRREDDEEHENNDDDENGTVSTRTIRRLQQLKRLNLTASSDSSSEDEVELKSTTHKNTSKIKNVSQEKQTTVMKEERNIEEEDKKHFGKSNEENSNRLQSTEHSDNEKPQTNISDFLKDEQQPQGRIEEDAGTVDSPPVEEELSNVKNRETTTQHKQSTTSFNLRKIEEDADTMDSQSTEEEFSDFEDEETNIRQKRPTTLEELIDQEKLVTDETPASFNIKNIEDEEEVYILNIPSALNVRNLRGKKMVLNKNKLKLENDMYKIKYKNLGSVTCVFHKGKKHSSYKVVNTRPLGSISTRYKYFDLPDSLNAGHSTEDDAFD